MEDNDEGAERPPPSSTGKKSVIKIPSFQGTSSLGAGEDGVGGTSTSTSASHPKAASFSQAFSFVKSSEFYSPPPPPPPPAASQAADCARGHSAAAQSEDVPVGGIPSSSNGSSSSSPANFVAGSRNAILVSHRQKGNPLLKHIRNVRWVFADVVCDYLLGQTSCALYISLRYHLLHPDYLYYRIRELQKNFKLRVVLCHIDVEDVAKPLLEVTRTALLHDCTLLCGWRYALLISSVQMIKIVINSLNKEKRSVYR
ncbi:hypothetical protein Taro_030954 [Colocasia esculenta]|uniref:ERCC1-like central domain-containing protein n=1 Tax=Colocasia esculenta TaxID=4460 RepID=A0A843VZE9_COLES|nr:hypothetical protein [Colocasia esculenta]